MVVGLILVARDICWVKRGLGQAKEGEGDDRRVWIVREEECERSVISSARAAGW